VETLERKVQLLTAEVTHLRQQLQAQNNPLTSAVPTTSIQTNTLANWAVAVNNSNAAKKAKLQQEWADLMKELMELMIKNNHKSNPEIEACVTKIVEKRSEMVKTFRDETKMQLDFSVLVYTAFNRGVANTIPNFETASDEGDDMVLISRIAPELDMTEQQMRQVANIKKKLRDDTHRLRLQRRKLSEEIIILLQNEFSKMHKANSTSPTTPQNDTSEGMPTLVNLSARLSELKKNWDEHWDSWENAYDAVREVLNTQQMPHVILLMVKHFENVNLLSSIWKTLNGQPPPPTIINPMLVAPVQFTSWAKDLKDPGSATL